MAEPLKVMSFNIRFDNPSEAEQDKWDTRKETCFELIKKHQPHLLGLQEPHQHQVDQVAAALPGYSWFGQGRYITLFGINEQHNELNPVFYDHDALTLDGQGTFWYSDTPDVPNTKWACSAFPRIATWGRFTVKATGNKLCFINTHFDHESEEARTKAAEMLIKYVPTISLGLPVIVVGDLNCGHGSPALAKLSDALCECSSNCEEVLPGMLGKVGTFVGFDKSIDSQIDFIFVNHGFKPSAYGVVPDECPNGRCCSDHRPIMVNLDFCADYVIEEPPESERITTSSADALAASASNKAQHAAAKMQGVASSAEEKAAYAAAQVEEKSRAAALQAEEAARRAVAEAEAVANQAVNALSSLFKGL